MIGDSSPDTESSYCRRGAWISFGLMFAGICAIIVVANSGSTNPVFRLVKSIPYGDKVIHAILFGTLAYLANRALGFRCLVGRRWVQVGSLGVLVFALGEELTQGLNPHRSLDALDAAADIGGVAIATWLAYRVTKEANADSPP